MTIPAVPMTFITRTESRFRCTGSSESREWLHLSSRLIIQKLECFCLFLTHNSPIKESTTIHQKNYVSTRCLATSCSLATIYGKSSRAQFFPVVQSTFFINPQFTTNNHALLITETFLNKAVRKKFRSQKLEKVKIKTSLFQIRTATFYSLALLRILRAENVSVACLQAAFSL